jgi:hypothetical protein
VVGILGASCGGAGGGTVAEGGSGQGLVLLSFLQDSQDNVSLNTRLELQFSDTVDPATVSGQTLQIRRGGQFGEAAPGSFRVVGSTVFFDPNLPGLCDLSDAGFVADTQYRVQAVGAPEEFSIRNLRGQPLDETHTYQFHTRQDSDPALFSDQMPGSGPEVLSSAPLAGADGVAVVDGNRVVLTLSENLQPCTVDETTVLFDIYQFGDPSVHVTASSGRPTGFATAGGDTTDQTPGNPYTWGTAATHPTITTLPLPQKILAHIELRQSFTQTQIIVTPSYGYNANPLLNKSRFPENSLCVLQLTSGIRDFGGLPLTPFALSFTTENLPLSSGTYVVETLGETPWDPTLSTARIDENPPGLVQAFLLFAGDGDNGTNQLSPSHPQVAPSCTVDLQSNDNVADDFDPAADVLLDTGSTRNVCPNSTDGSRAVVWEFHTLHIRNGVTVRIVGVNPAILLVQGDASIDAGGRLLVRGDGGGGAPQGKGEGNKTASVINTPCNGGIGVAGGGDGGTSPGGNGAGSARYSGSGYAGYFHTMPTSGPDPDVGVEGGTGAGHGNSSCYWTTQTTNNRNTPSGGGGGHATAGAAGVANGTGSSPTQVDLPLDGAGGVVYGENSDRMLKPEAGGGGGSGAELRPFTGTVGQGPGGGGGAGGGFVDLTSGGNIVVLGTIDAAGSSGGSNPGNVFNPNYTYNPGTGGGGGGGGGGIRLLTPYDIVVGASTVLTAAGGAGGAGGVTQGNPGTPAANPGGAGGMGRIALEDSNSIITGIAGASVTPGDGSAGFYRGVFDSTRFQGGGLNPSATSEVFAVGPFNPTFLDPVQTYPTPTDFLAGAPSAAVSGPGKTVMLIEIKGYQMLPDGSVDMTGVIAPPTPWHTVGYFKDSGIENQPTWVMGQPPLADIGGSLPLGNTGVLGISHVNTCEYIQIRVTMYLSTAVGPTDPGHYLDRWTIHFTSDN